MLREIFPLWRNLDAPTTVAKVFIYRCDAANREGLQIWVRVASVGQTKSAEPTVVIQQGYLSVEASKPIRFHTDVCVLYFSCTVNKTHPDSQTQIALGELRESALWARLFARQFH